jgi:hypothetical protein
MGLALAMVALAPAWAAPVRDKKSDSVFVRGDKFYRDDTARPILAVYQPAFCRPGLTDEALITSFIRISDVGGTALCFDLEGFNNDGAVLDAEFVKEVRRVKEQANKRWMHIILRVLGEFPSAPDDVRKNAVETAARELSGDTSILVWIDGPGSRELVEAFRAGAPRVTVLAPWNGDVDLVGDTDHAVPGKPAVVWGSLPPRGARTRNAILPDTQESLDALEAANRQPAELRPWNPTSVGLTWEERADGWISLYDGRTLDGWSITGDNQNGFVSRNGVLSWNESGGRSLQSRDRYGDFMLRFEWKLYKKGANNGMWLRAPRANRSSKMGFEFQIMGDSAEKPVKDSTGSVYDAVAPKENAARPEGEWNEVEIYLNGPIYNATLNGVLVQDLNFDDDPELKHRLRRGFICITDHGARASFRNIRIKKL